MTSENALCWWWQALMAIPSDRSSEAYERLKRVWFDHTWNNHPFLNFSHEIHLTATLFENFALFSPDLWVGTLMETAGLPTPLESVEECRWAYEVLDTKTAKLADVAIHARTGNDEFVVILEAKRKGGALKKEDVDPGSYLDLEEFRWCKNRVLIYLVDEVDKAKVLTQIKDFENRSAVLTWQELGGIQIKMAQTLDYPIQIRSFVAGAIQFQYLQHRITPTVLAHAYLRDELGCDFITKDNPDKMRDYYTQWKLHTKTEPPFS
jgi:hypothetical protein